VEVDREIVRLGMGMEGREGKGFEGRGHNRLIKEKTRMLRPSLFLLWPIIGVHLLGLVVPTFQTSPLPSLTFLPSYLAF
jgi:hypothetical protein